MSATDSCAALPASLATAFRSSAARSSRAFRLLAIDRGIDLSSLLQLVDSICYDNITRIQPLGDFRLLAFRGPDGNVTDSDCVVRLHQPYIYRLRIALNGLIRH